MDLNRQHDSFMKYDHTSLQHQSKTQLQTIEDLQFQLQNIQQTTYDETSHHQTILKQKEQDHKTKIQQMSDQHSTRLQ